MLNFIAKTTDYLVPAMDLFDRFDGYGCGPMGGYWGGAGGFGFFGMLIFVLFWIGILAIAALIISKILRGNSVAVMGGSRGTPVDILQKRYASGEITEKEYLSMKKNLMEK